MACQSCTSLRPRFIRRLLDGDPIVIDAERGELDGGTLAARTALPLDLAHLMQKPFIAIAR